MSGTFEMAAAAAEGLPVKAVVIDSKGPTMSLGWQVLAAARARDAGADVEEILRQVERVRQRLVLLVGMTSLKYLRQGGRIGEAAKWAGSLLKVMPLIAVNHQKGVVEPVSLTRTRHALVDLLFDSFRQRLAGMRDVHVAVLHGDAPAEAEALAARIRAECSPVELLINLTGPVLGINTGPGALALCGYGEA
jgi:DegV family protein with EDD domain